MILKQNKDSHSFDLQLVCYQVRQFGPSGLITSSSKDWRMMQASSFCPWGTFSHCKLRQIECTKCSCTWSVFLAANTVEIRWEMDLTEDRRVGVYESDLRLFEAVVAAARGSFTLDWRSIAGGGGRGRCHRLWLVLVRRAEGARCQSSCYRRSPHSSYSGAGERQKGVRATMSKYSCVGCCTVLF